MSELQRRLKRMDALEREYFAACSAVDLLQNALRQDPNWAKQGEWSVRDAKALSENLDSTFLIRLFAEFEAGLRAVWRDSFDQKSMPRMRDLIIALASKRRIPEKVQSPVDEVRDYRNSLVHEWSRDKAVIPLTFSAAKQRLHRYFGRMPSHWSPGPPSP